MQKWKVLSGKGWGRKLLAKEKKGLLQDRSPSFRAERWEVPLGELSLLPFEHGGSPSDK